MWSYYSATLYKAVRAGFDLKLILSFTCPSTLIGALSIAICLNVSIRMFTFYFLYTRLMRKRVHKLSAALFKLAARPTRKRLLAHLNQVNWTIREWEVSREYFTKSLGAIIPVVLITLALFPSMLILSESSIFTNRLTGFYVANLFGLLLPIVIMNEHVKKEVRIVSQRLSQRDSLSWREFEAFELKRVFLIVTAVHHLCKCDTSIRFEQQIDRFKTETDQVPGDRRGASRVHTF